MPKFCVLPAVGRELAAGTTPEDALWQQLRLGYTPLPPETSFRESSSDTPPASVATVKTTNSTARKPCSLL